MRDTTRQHLCDEIAELAGVRGALQSLTAVTWHDADYLRNKINEAEENATKKREAADRGSQGQSLRQGTPWTHAWTTDSCDDGKSTQQSHIVSPPSAIRLNYLAP